MFMVGYVNIVQTVGNQRSVSKVVKAARHPQLKLKQSSRASQLAQVTLIQSIRSNQSGDDIRGDVQTYAAVFGQIFLKGKIEGQSILEIADQVGNFRAVDAIIDELTKK